MFNFCVSFFYKVALDASSQNDIHLTGTGATSYVKAVDAPLSNPVKGNLMVYGSNFNQCHGKWLQ